MPSLRVLDISHNEYTSLDWLAGFPGTSGGDPGSLNKALNRDGLALCVCVIAALERVSVAGNPLPAELRAVVTYRLADICPRLAMVNVPSGTIDDQFGKRMKLLIALTVLALCSRCR